LEQWQFWVKSNTEKKMNQKMNDKIEKNSTVIENVQKLLDKDAIKEMWYNSCYLVDEGDIDGVMESFTGDAVMDAGAFGRAEGRESLTGSPESINHLFITHKKRTL
jgi:hypothetical protein